MSLRSRGSHSSPSDPGPGSRACPVLPLTSGCSPVPLPGQFALTQGLPLQLVKTHNLLTSRNYTFGYHPHGIMGLGAFCNFSTEATEVSKKFWHKALPGHAGRQLPDASAARVPDV